MKTYLSGMNRNEEYCDGWCYECLGGCAEYRKLKQPNDGKLIIAVLVSVMWLTIYLSI